LNDKKAVDVAFVIAALVIGGAERQLLYLLQELDRNRYRPRLYAFNSGPWYARFMELGIPIEIISYELGRVRVISRLARRLHQLRPKLVHTFGHTANAVGRLAALSAGHSSVIVSERSTPRAKSFNIRVLDRILAPFTTALITNSSHAAKYWRNKSLIRRSRAWVVKNGIIARHYATMSGSLDGKQLVTVGDMRWEKNHALLLDAISLVANKIPSVQLTIAGDGPLRCKLEEQVRQLEIERNISFPGFINDIPKILSKSDVYVHTAHYEGLPNAVMEAMASAMPCVVTDSEGCLELIQNGVNGLVVEGGNARALADALLRLLHDPNSARQMGKAGRSKIEQDYTIQKMVGLTETVYKSVLCTRNDFNTA